MGIRHDDLLAMIDQIYAASLEPARWNGVLARIADAFGAREASLGGVTSESVPWIFAPRTDPDFLASYQQHFHPLNLFWQRLVAQPAGTVATDRMLLPKRELHRSEFFNDWSEPQDYLTVMGATLLVENGGRTEFMLPGGEDFDEEQVTALRVLVPHLARACQIMHRLHSAEVGIKAFAEALERARQPALMLDAQARLLHASGSALAMLAAEPVLGISEGRLACARPDDTAAIRRLAAACARGEPGDHGGRLAIARGEGRLPLYLLFSPARAGTEAGIWFRPGALVFLEDPEIADRARLKLLQDRFGLTAAEAAFALEIVQGDGRRAAGARRGISDSTARTHLSNIFEKTGTRRQAELVRLLLSAGDRPAG